MDVHRSRFVPYPLSAITALAFSRSNDSGFTGSLPPLRLAIGRANGTIELWNPQRGTWVQETILAGGEPTGIDDLAWTHDLDDSDPSKPGRLRLFSIASSPSVTEWDLVAGKPKTRSSGNFSEVWAFAAQPRARASPEQEAQAIIAGCGDGALVLLGTGDNELQFRRVLVRVPGKRARCMCVTWQTREKVVAGFADSMIRVYDVRNGTCLVGLGLGVGVPGAPRTALVWKVRCLANGDIVSGDSNGELRVWDGKMYAQLQRLVAHGTDCLDLVTSADGKTIMSGSMDGKVAVFKLTNDGQGRKIWAKNGHRRAHNGEIKAMATFDSKALSVVISGGADSTPAITPLREYGRENPRTLLGLPQNPPVASAPKARLLVSWWETDVYVWRIARQTDIDAQPRRLVAHISLKNKAQVRDVSISEDGRLLAAATNTGVRLFQLRRRFDSDTLAIRKVDIPKDIGRTGTRLVSISPDLKWMVSVTLDSEIHIGRIVTDIESPKRLQVVSRTMELERSHRRQARSTALMSYDRTITHMAFSPDSQMLAAGDLSGFVDSWTLDGTEDLSAAPAQAVARESSSDSESDSGSDSDSTSDSDDEVVVFHGHQWNDNLTSQLLPKLDSAPLVMTFRPVRTQQAKHLEVSINGDSNHIGSSSKYLLWCMTTRHHMYEFDMSTGRLSEWSRRNPTSVLPADFVKIRDRVVGAIWDAEQTSRQRLWLYGSSFVFMLDVSSDLGDAGQASESKRKRRRRGSRNRNDDEDDLPDSNTMRKQRKLESGAGDRLKSHSHNGNVNGIKHYNDDAIVNERFEGDDSEDEQASAQAANQEDASDEDDDMPLTRLRGADEDDDDDDNNNNDEASKKANGVEDHSSAPRKWWYSFKYRPILGMVPLETEDASDDAGDAVRPLEVALVERPQWDVVRDRK